MSAKNTPGAKTSRRQFLRSLAALSAGIGLASCSSAGQQTTEPATGAQDKPVAQPASAEPVTLEWYTCYGTWGEAGLQAAVDEYQTLNSGVKFAPLIFAMESTQGALEGLLSRIAAGTPPDIALLWNSPVSLGVRGAATPLDDLMATSRYSAKDAWPELPFRSCVFGGKTYGFPSFVAIYCMFYNVDAFAEKGLSVKREDFPKTWDELKALSRNFTQYDGNTPTRVGYFPLWNFFTDMWLQFNGGGCYDFNNSAYHIDKQENIEALEYAVTWINEEYQGNYDSVKGTGWDFWDDMGGQPAFQDGRMVMLQGGNFSFGMYAGDNPPQHKIDVARFPQGPSSRNTHFSTYYGNWILIPAGAKNVKPAFEFIDWFHGEGVMNWLKNAPDAPGSLKFYEKHPDFVSPLLLEHFEESVARDYQQFFNEQLKVAVDMFASPVAAFQWDQISRAAERVLKNAATAPEALAEAQRACAEELTKALQKA